MNKILIIDDDRDMRSELSDIVRSEGHEAYSACSGRTALKEISTHSPDIVILDIKLRGEDGMTILERIREMNSTIIMMTGHGDIKDAVKAIKTGAFDYITKPFDNDEIASVIKKAIQNRQQACGKPPVALSLREKRCLTG